MTKTRTQEEILTDIQNVHCAMSPENLYCDGEISRAAARRKAKQLKTRLRSLETELGRIPSFGEVWGD